MSLLGDRVVLHTVHLFIISMNLSPITVVAVDDHILILGGIKLELSNQAGIQLVATGTRGRDVVRLVQTYSPDVLVLDVEMPEGDDKEDRFDAIGTIADIHAHHPQTKLIIISHASSKFLVNAVISAGAAAFIDKMDLHCASSLPRAIETVHGNGVYLSPELYHMLGKSGPITETILTEQQYKVLALCAAYPDETIAELSNIMSVSVSAFKKYLKAAADKLNAKTTRGALFKAVQLGIIPLRPIDSLLGAGGVNIEL